jgi:hypothetical protein
MILFTVGCVLMFVNLFIAIVSEHYDKVNAEDEAWATDVRSLERQGVIVPTAALSAAWADVRHMLSLDNVRLQVDTRPAGMHTSGPDGTPRTITPASMVSTQPSANVATMVRLRFNETFTPVALDGDSGCRLNVPVRDSASGDTFNNFQGVRMNPMQINRTVLDAWTTDDAPALASVTLRDQYINSPEVASFFQLIDVDGVVRLKQGSHFGSTCTLKLLMRENVEHVDAFGRWTSSFLLFRVTHIASPDQVSANKPLKLLPQNGVWSIEEDKLLWQWHQRQDPSESLASVASMLDKSERELQLRVGFLEQQHRDETGSPQPPKLLKGRLVIPWRMTLKIWCMAYCSSDRATDGCSCKSWCRRDGRRSCCFSSKAQPWEQDMKIYIARYVDKVKNRTNMRDLRAVQRNFLDASCSIDKAIDRMISWLQISGHRTQANIDRIYGSQDDVLMGRADNLVNREHLRHWILSNYCAEIDGAAIVELETNAVQDNATVTDDASAWNTQEEMETEHTTENPLTSAGREISHAVGIDGAPTPPARPTVSTPSYSRHWSDEQSRPYWRNEDTGEATWCGLWRDHAPALLCPTTTACLASASVCRAATLGGVTQPSSLLRRRNPPIIEPIPRLAQKKQSPRALDIDSGSPRFAQEQLQL